MKTLYRLSLSALGSLLTMLLIAALSDTAAAQTGQIQWIHASADPALIAIDVYVDGELELDDFGYQMATPFGEPIPGPHQIVVAPENSSGIADSIATFSINIAEDSDYHLIIAGVEEPDAFRPNPDGRSTALDLFVVGGARQASLDPQAFTTRQFYGVIDLSAVTFRSEGSILVQNIRFGETTDYLGGEPGTYIGRIGVTGRASGSLYAVEGDFTGHAGKSMLSVVSGFFATPTGLGFDWYNVYPDGTVVHPTDLTEYSRLQFVHASPDSSIREIDVYLDGSLLLNDFEFKTATGFMHLPSGFHDFHVAPASSASDDDALKNLRSMIVSGDTSHAIVAGVLDPEAFRPNPDGRSTDLQLYMGTGALEASDEAGHPALRQFYGVPNLPSVTFTTEGFAVASNVRYGDFTDYAYPEPRNYDGGFSATGLATGALYRAPGSFTGLADQAVLGVFTGFFGVDSGITNFLVAADGTVITNEATTPTMRAQIVHASADPALKTIDLYFDGIPLLVSLSFTRATPFMDLPSGVHEIAVAPIGSTSKSDAVETYRVSYREGSSYSMVLAGVLNPDMFAPNPDGKDTGLNLFVTDDALEESSNPGEFSIRQFFGVINLPTSNFWIEEWSDGPLFQSFGYGDFTEFTNGQHPGELTGAVRPVGSPRTETPIISTVKDWGGHEGRTILSLFAGYTYDEHPGGYSGDIRAFYVLADGRSLALTPFGTWTSTEDETEIPTAFTVTGNYPNPFNPATNVTFDLPHPAKVSVEVFDVAGRLVLTTSPVNMPAGNGQSVRINATAWNSGLYFYKVIARSGTSSWIGTGQMMLVK